jgi:lipopolysaccharide export system protein LptA
VHITNADRSVTIDGDFAKYHGNIKFAEIWDNVVLVDSNSVLKTPHLYYELTPDIAYYVSGAEIFNKTNDMVSKRGHYHRRINMFYFKEDVVLNTPDYTIVTDTLNYNVQTEIADFVGPTYIQNEADTIYCERGWYNTTDTVAFFRRNAWIKSGSTTVNSDTLYYESQTGNGRAFGNIVIVDTTNNIILKGQKGEFHKPTEHAWLTGRRALLIMAGEKDSLYLHADTLRSDVDTAGFKIMRAYNRVRFFSADMQGKCDSMAVALSDTVVHMFKLPILWAQDNQMTADHIAIETENQQPKRMNLNNKGFITQEDPSGFNQIKGRKVVGLFRDNELYRVNGFNDAETIYYFYDGPDVTGANKMKSTNVVILSEDKQAQEVNHKENVEGELIPPHEFSQDELTLSGFRWQIKIKPVDREDIYEWKEEEPAPKTAPPAKETKEPPGKGNNAPAPANKPNDRRPARR